MFPILILNFIQKIHTCIAITSSNKCQEQDLTVGNKAWSRLKSLACQILNVRKEINAQTFIQGNMVFAILHT